MQHTSTGERCLAIVAGIGFTVGTCLLIFEDVATKSAPLEVKHAITLIVIACTILVGHLAHNAQRARQWRSMLGFVVCFLAGTGLVVLSSVGRQGETQMLSQAQADLAAEQRHDVKSKLSRAEAMKEQAQKAVEAECATGLGKKCLGKKATLEVYTAAVAGHQAALSKLGPPKPVAPEAEKLAELAAVFGAPRDKVKAMTILAKPFFTALFLEFGAIVSFGFGFRPSARSAVKRATKSEAVSAKDTAQTSFPVETPRQRLFPKLINKPSDWQYERRWQHMLN